MVNRFENRHFRYPTLQEHQMPLREDTVTQLPNHEVKNTVSLINNRDTRIFSDFIFLLCKSCFWCASLLDIEKRVGSFQKCKRISVLRMMIYQPLTIRKGGSSRTCGCKAKGGRIVTYTLIDSYHGLCLDKGDIILSELEACSTLLNHSINDTDRSVIKK